MKTDGVAEHRCVGACFLDDGSGRGFYLNVEHDDEVCVAGV